MTRYALCTRRRQAFTLLEMMVAMVIISLVTSSLYMSFRTGMRAYSIGLTHSESGQMARYTVAQVAGDLRNIFYKPENTYNVTRRQREAMEEERMRQALQSGSEYNPDEQMMPELGPRIDLSFRASDSGETDELTFVRLQTLTQPEDRMMWNLARVHYFVSGNSLYRSIDDVKLPEVDENGYEIPKAVPPQIDKIANNVKSFDMNFGYYYDGEWLTASDWESGSAQYRNPAEEEEEENELLAETTAAGGYSTGSEQMIYDDLPAWVELTLVFTDPKNEEKDQTYYQVVQLPQSQETYIPADLDDPNARESGRMRQGRRNRR